MAANANDAKDRERIKSLLEVLRINHDRCTAVIEELETLLAGGVGIADKLKEAEMIFGELWASRYRSAYIWQYAKDRPNLKRLIKTLGPAELHARMARYLQNTDQFFTGRRHPFALFVSTIVQHAAANDQPIAGELELAAPVADCKHVPPCRSDRDHTRLRSAEMREGF